jgi:hypothetical protein
LALFGPFCFAGFAFFGALHQGLALPIVFSLLFGLAGCALLAAFCFALLGVALLCLSF